MIASERPSLTGRRCQEAEGSADNKGDENSSHDRSTGVAVSSAVENLDKVIASGASQVVSKVTKAEAESDDDGETERAVEENRADHAPRDNGRCILHFFSHMDGTIIS